jgi:hypothetical protein
VLAAAVAVIIAADLVVAGVASHLRQPQFWPTFEAQNKYELMKHIPPRSGLVFAGDSVLDSAVNPILLTPAQRGAFNASLAGEPLSVISEWLERVVLPVLHPRTVVLGFDINILNIGNAAGEATLASSFHHSRPVAVAEGRGDVLDHLDGWLHAHVALYKFRSVLRQPFSSSDLTYNPPVSGWAARRPIRPPPRLVLTRTSCSTTG